MKKSLKILFVIILFAIIINVFYTVVYADDSIKGWADSFINAGGNGKGGDMSPAINQIAGVLTGIGVFGVVIVGAVLGIQFMLGSATEQAKIKESLVPYAIGSIIVMGAAGIFNAVVGALNSANI